MMKDSYEDIVREWYRRLRPEFLRRMSNRFSWLTFGEAENIYQDAFIAVHDNLKRGAVKENTSWRNYIMAIGVNMATKCWRQKSNIDSMDNTLSSSTLNPTLCNVNEFINNIDESEYDFYTDPEAQALMGKELIRTPEPCASIIRLFYYENLSMSDIAEEVGYKNAETAKAKKSQCMKSLVVRVKNSLRKAGIIE